MSDSAAPQGFMENAVGHLVPTDLVSDIDKMRDKLVKEIIEDALALQAQLAKFKSKAMDDIAAFIQLSGEKYDAKIGGEKGNVTLSSFDGRYQIRRQISETLVFDERLQVAKELVDQCINRWSEGSNSEIKALVQHAFQTDKKNRINTARVISLTKLQIKDEQWKKAMQAIMDSIQVEGSRAYIRVYQRLSRNKYEQINLDITSLDMEPK